MTKSAVITGDIVSSTQLSKPMLNKLLQNLRDMLAPYPHEFFRGDSFQVLIKDAQEAYNLLLQLRMIALKLTPDKAYPVTDIRASIGLGSVKFPVKNMGTATDEAFVLSGRLFEQLKTGERLLIASPEKNKDINTGLRLIAGFTDFILQRLTAKQAEVLYELLLQKTQSEIARTLKKSQVTVHKHAQAAGWSALEKLITEYKLLAGSLIL